MRLCICASGEEHAHTLACAFTAAEVGANRYSAIMRLASHVTLPESLPSDLECFKPAHTRSTKVQEAQLWFPNNPRKRSVVTSRGGGGGVGCPNGAPKESMKIAERPSEWSCIFQIMQRHYRQIKSTTVCCAWETYADVRHRIPTRHLPLIPYP